MLWFITIALGYKQEYILNNDETFWTLKEVEHRTFGNTKALIVSFILDESQNHLRGSVMNEAEPGFGWIRHQILFAAQLFFGLNDFIFNVSWDLTSETGWAKSRTSGLEIFRRAK